MCGVAMREGDVILVADMCYKPLKYEKYDNNLPKVANITVDDSGRRFKVSTCTSVLGRTVQARF